MSVNQSRPRPSGPFWPTRSTNERPTTAGRPSNHPPIHQSLRHRLLLLLRVLLVGAVIPHPRHIDNNPSRTVLVLVREPLEGFKAAEAPQEICQLQVPILRRRVVGLWVVVVRVSKGVGPLLGTP